MKLSPSSRKTLITIVILCLFFLFCVFFAFEYKHIRKFNYLPHHPVTGINEVSTIGTWMTFDYINHLFHIPSLYLQDTLNITDTRYPQLTLLQFAEDTRSQPIDTLSQVQNAVRTFFIQQQLK